MSTALCTSNVRNDALCYDLRYSACITPLTIGPDQPQQPGQQWLGLVETFERLEEIPALAHTTPGAGIAQLELLLATCFAAGVHPRTTAEWKTWVISSRPLVQVADTLREPRFDGVFDVCHPEHPFGQNQLLAPFLRAHGYGPAQLTLERAADGAQFTDHVHLHDDQPLPIEHAVQAMLVQHAYGLGGRVRAKTGWLGAAFTYAAVGRLAGRVRTIALGDTLADTLRLNLQPTTRPGTFNASWTDASKPRRTFTGTGAKYSRTPDGPADLHSVLGRSILLSPQRTSEGRLVVDKVLMGAGELLGPLGQQWLQDTPLEGDRPLQASPDKALWRQSHALYAAATPNTKGTDLFSRLLMIDRRVTLWSVALTAKQRTPLGWISDTFPFHGRRHTALRQASADAVTWATYLDRAAWTAAAVARDLTYPRARPEERTRLLRRFHPGPQLWASIEEPFHLLLDDIADSTETDRIDQARARFASAITGLAHQLLEQRLTSLPRTGSGLEAAVRAKARFRSELSKRTTPPELMEAAMTLSPPTRPATSKKGAATDAEGLPGHKRLGHWLTHLARTFDHERLGALRRRHNDRQPRMEAAAFAPCEDHRLAYQLTAHLFARYHAGLPTQDPVRLYGSGDLGQAMRRIGTPGGHGPKDPGCLQLFKRLTTAGPLPLRPLQHAIDRLRALDRTPPHWGQLAGDLASFTTPTSQAHTQDVWARSFYTPTSRTRQGATK